MTSYNVVYFVSSQCMRISAIKYNFPANLRHYVSFCDQDWSLL